MKIVVLVKQTPDTEAKITTNEAATELDHAATKFIMNPYDEYAIEEALKLKTSQGGDSEVVLMTFAEPAVKERILKGLAMGADRAIIINNQGLENCDSLVVARILKEAIQQEQPDLVFTGKQGIDADNMHTPVMVAELLGWPHVNVVTKLEMTDSTARVEREVEGGQVECYSVQLPAVLGAHKSLNNPRYASLPGIMKAKKKPMDLKTPADLGLDMDALMQENQTEIEGYTYPAPKPQGKVFKDGTVEEKVAQVVQLLREEAKII